MMNRHSPPGRFESSFHSDDGFQKWLRLSAPDVDRVNRVLAFGTQRPDSNQAMFVGEANAASCIPSCPNTFDLRDLRRPSIRHRPDADRSALKLSCEVLSIWRERDSCHLGVTSPAPRRGCQAQQQRAEGCGKQELQRREAGDAPGQVSSPGRNLPLRSGHFRLRASLLLPHGLWSAHRGVWPHPCRRLAPGRPYRRRRRPRPEPRRGPNCQH